MLGVVFSSKLVRGAYLTEESKLAIEKEEASPVYSTKALVDNSFDSIVAYMIANLPEKSKFCLATHNEVSMLKGLKLGVEHKEELERKKAEISFAQLKGLGDRLTFGLAREGFVTFKYLPYGETVKLFPYLFRRAEEASYIGGEGRKKLEDVKRELFGRRHFHYKFSVGALAGAIPLILFI